MVISGSDPYAILGLTANVGDAELRAAYRSAVQRHHPDHNGGSPESARRFEEIQEAYARIRARRGTRSAGAGDTERDPNLDSRLEDIERELATAREAQERARRAAQEAARAAGEHRSRSQASDQELGYITTEDSFGKIFTDAAAGLSEHLADARRPPADPAPGAGAGAGEKVADLLDDISARLRGEPRGR
ncbi:MAG: J domain-containing protein [Solirubrobacteraceae bacterium]